MTTGKYERKIKKLKCRRCGKEFMGNHNKLFCSPCQAYKAHDWYRRNPWGTNYNSAQQRCHSKSKKYYGAKGIKFNMTVDDFKELWFRDKAYLMKKPSIDRKNSKGHYTKENCRFIEFSENVSRAIRKLKGE